MDNENKVFPESTPLGDRAYQLAEVVTSLIPAGQPILNALITPPVQKRLDRWVGEVDARLSELEKKGEISFEAIKENENFSALVLKLVRVAGATAQQAKLKHLQNFVIQMAKEPDRDEDELCIMLSILEEFTPSHVKVLQFYANPEKFGNQIAGMSHALTQGQVQGKELAHIFGGKPEYWQYVFWSASGKHVVSNITTKVQCNASMERKINGKITSLGLKLIELVGENS